MKGKQTMLSDFLSERKSRIKHNEANQLGLRRIKKIDFDGNIHLSAGTDTKTDMIRIKCGDLVVSGINAAKGAIAIYEDKPDILATIHYSAYRFDPDQISIEFLKWFFKSAEFSNLLKEQVGGGIKTELKPKHILPLKVKIPRLSAQATIAARLNNFKTKHAELGKEITRQGMLLAKLKQAILQEAIQGKLTADWRAENPKVEPADELIRRIQAEKSRLVAEKKIRKEKPLPEITADETPFEIPETWEWCRLLTISKKIHYGLTASADPTIKKTQFLRITDIQNDQVDWASVPGCQCSEVEREKYLLNVGDILIARTGGTVGKSFLVNSLPIQSVFASYLIRIVPPSMELAKFMKLYLGSECYWSQLLDATHGAQPNVSGSRLKQLLFPLPPYAEQPVIVNRIDAMFGVYHKLATEISRSQTYATTLIQSVLKEEFVQQATK